MPINFNKAPYYDDFSEDSHFMKLLFQPGRSVQARELTQIQSLLQNQIDNFGKHLFQNGSTVVGGKINYDKTHIKWLAVQPLDGSGNKVFINQIVPGQRIRKPLGVDDRDNAVDAEIMGVVPAEKGSPDTLFIKFNGKTGGSESDFGANSELFIYDPETGEVRYKVKTLEMDSYNKARHIGTSSWVTVEAGVYFWNGMFLKSEGGTVRLSKYGTAPTYRVGFFVEESIVTDDPRSLDPASASTNYFAPGADRYQVKMTLTRIGDGLTFNDVGDGYQKVDNFIEICRVDSGTLLRAPGDKTLYNVLRDRLADRTFETSGNFVARPYKLAFENITTDSASEMRAKLSDGVAYVRGYRRGLDEQNTLRILKGRDSESETISIDNKYGDNFVIVYDGTSAAEKANGIFTIGSGAGQAPITAVANGFRGEAVSVHCVPHSKVKDYSLLDADTWNSTLVATARPMQMSYNKTATDAGRGSCYNLWLADVKTSSISGTATVTNKKTIAGATRVPDSGGGGANTQYTFSSDSTHGIIAGDRVSVSESANGTQYEVDNAVVIGATDTYISVGGLTGEGASGSLTLTRTTGNTNPKRTIVLDPNTSAAWNDSYVGATIEVGGSSAKTIVGYVGANTKASGLWGDGEDQLPSTHPALVIVDSDFDAIPTYGSTYRINLGMKQARSVVYNLNKDATGAEQYPATLNKAWNIDPISGVDNKGDSTKVDSTLYGGRVDGDCKFNIYGDLGHDSLIFPLGSDAVKRTVNHGKLDTGFNSNSVIYYTEYMRNTGSVTFVLPAADKYKFCARPSMYPYVNKNITDLITIRENFILIDETTNEVITNNISGINIQTEVSVVAAKATVTMSPAATAVHEYILIAPAKALNIKPAKKKLVVASSTIDTTADAEFYTNLLEGQLQVNSPSDITQRISLKVPDVFRIKKILHKFRNDSDDHAQVDLANGSLDITDRFNFNDGQKDMYYDNAFITKKETADTPTGNLFVLFDYFQRTDAAGALSANSPSFFSVDSYQTTTDLTFDSHISSVGFSVGDRVRGNSGAVGYVVEFANTDAATAAKMQLEGVTGTSVAGDVITSFYASGAGKYANVVSVKASELSYSEIPSYRASPGQEYNLKNMIDFRPYVSTYGRVSDTIQDSMMMPLPSGAALRTGKDATNVPRLLSSHGIESYLGRIDKLILTKDGKYTTIKGIPRKDKRPPIDLPPNEALTLFTLNIPAYTNDLSKIIQERSVAVRHTMRDIGRLAQRVENLEYYVSLNSLEQSARDFDVSFADGTERFKNGILTDNFTNLSVINADETVAALGKGVLRPVSRNPGVGPYNFNFSPTETTSGNPGDITSRDVLMSDDGDIVGRVLTLGYSTETFIQQPDACVVESVNPFDLQNYTGTLQLFPDFDRWIDITKSPEVNSDLGTESLMSITPTDTAETVLARLEQMDGLWSDIVGSPIGEFSGVVTHTTENPLDASFETDTFGRSITLESVGGRVNDKAKAQVDAAIIQASQWSGSASMLDGTQKSSNLLPFIRERDIVVAGKGLRPNRNAELIFDGEPIEWAFGRATEIFIDKSSIPPPDPAAEAVMRPESQSKSFEKIKLSSGGHFANAILLAVRDYQWTNYADNPNGDTDAEKLAFETQNIKVGYIVPEFRRTGEAVPPLVDYAKIDGYYDGTWINSDVKNLGFQGASSRTITGYDSKVVYNLVQGGKLNPKNYYNGHYTGTVKNSDTANVTHMVLSPDASRYIANNFGADAGLYEGIPSKTIIKIVHGTGRGQELYVHPLAAGLALPLEDSCPVVAVEGLKLGAGGSSIDTTSVYSIRMKPLPPEVRNHKISQLGTFDAPTNAYGDKFGILHLPGSRFSAGRKLVEIADRVDRAEWLVTSYASGYYFAEGREKQNFDFTEAEGDTLRTLEILKEVRSAMNAFKVNDFPNDFGYIQARNNLTNDDGKLAMAIDIKFIGGEYTGPQPFVPGPGLYGEVVNISSDEISITDYSEGVGNIRKVVVKNVDI